jgi:hypothetical protein
MAQTNIIKPIHWFSKQLTLSNYFSLQNQNQTNILAAVVGQMVLFFLDMIPF